MATVTNDFHLLIDIVTLAIAVTGGYFAAIRAIRDDIEEVKIDLANLRGELEGKGVIRS